MTRSRIRELSCLTCHGIRSLGTPSMHLLCLFLTGILLHGQEAWGQNHGGERNHAQEQSAPVLARPFTRRVEQVDEYHGVKVVDPYRWLEADVRTSPEVADWIAEQNRYTFAYLQTIPERDAVRHRLTELWDYKRYSSPFRAGGRIYFLRNDGLQDQSVLCVQDSLKTPPRVLIDPNGWSEDGTIALLGTSCSTDGRYMAYATQQAGSDWMTLRVLEIDSGRILDDEVCWVKFNLPAWTPDGDGFFYARFPEQEELAGFGAVNLNQKVFYHRVGRPQEEDVLIFERPDRPEWLYWCKVTEDGKYLLITAQTGTDPKHRLYLKDLSDPIGMPISIIDNFRNEFSLVGNKGPIFYFKTDLDAPRKRLVSIDVQKATEAFRAEEHRTRYPEVTEILPEQEGTLLAASLINDMLIVRRLKDARTSVSVYSLDGTYIRDIEMPGIGTAMGFRGEQSDVDTFFSYSSFNIPPSIYHCNLETGEIKLLHRPEVDFEPKQYEVRLEFFRSRDGTEIPLIIAHRKGLLRNGNHPALLHGYGGFGYSLTPMFSPKWLAWMEMDGVFAIACIRGGGEYGLEWHQAGVKLNKQTSFDDFIAAAEWLIENGYSSPARLAIQGDSNGGLLVGACMTQRPELFGACLPNVGVMDMLRFPEFTIGRNWVDDYGSPDDPDAFKVLLSYSPYHNVRPGTAYPATLITTADTDDRVVPAHSFKFAAALQHVQAGDAPILIRIETSAGHGYGKPTSKVIEEVADQWAFLVDNLEADEPAEQ